MKVEKRDGRIVDWDPTKIENAIRRAFESHKADSKPAKKLTDKVIKIIKNKNVDTIHIEEIQDIVEEVLMVNGYTETAKRYIKYREKRAVARRLLRTVGVVDDLKLGPNAATVAKRYLLKDDDGTPIETPSQLFHRVAKAVAKAEKIFDKSADYKTYEQLFYDMIANLEFMPNSPTLYNAGTDIGQLSACFVLPIRDDIDSIFNTLWHMARVQKSGGGCVKEGTKVLTKEHGLVEIEQIPGMKDITITGFPQTISPITLYSWNPVLQIFEERPVSQGWKFALDKTVRISYGSNGQIETSCWHPFYVWNGEKIQIKRADELVSGDSLLKNGIFDVPLTEKEASLWWLIGYIIADGCFDITVNGLRLRLFDERQEILQRANRIIAKYRNTRRLKLQKDPRENCYILKTTTKKKDSFIYHLYEIVGEDKLTPQFIPGAPFSFIAGLLDGDGYFGRDVISLYTSSDSLKDFLSSLLAMIGINYKVRRRDRTRFGIRSTGWEIAFSTGYGRLFPTERKPRLSKHKPFSFRRIQVKDVEIKGESATLYDFSVPINQNYLAGNGHLVVVHNTGFSFSQLRPKGTTVGSTGGVASGPVSFMRIYDTATDVIKQGGKRRGANMAILRCDHPDIMEFISAKADKKSFRNFNISVAVTHEFMHALKTGGNIDLINPHTGEVEQTISARMIFDSMILNAWNTGDPGMIFIDRINDEHPLKGKQIESTNPCVSGDTLIAVADGRNYVSIEDLAREGRGVPVFCWSGDGMVVRMGRNPRKTREQVPIVEVTFDDNSSLKLTKNHRVMLRDGSYVEAGSLKEGDRIMPFFKIQYRQRGKKSKYWHIHQNQNVFHRGEHKIIAEFMLGRKLKRSEVVHHINYDTLDNSWANIQIMTSHEHRKLHRRDMLGSNNPYHRMPEDWIKEHLAVGRSGEDNGMFGRIHSYETRVKISESTRRRFSDKKFSKIFRERMNEVMADQEIREKISIAAKERWKDSNLEGECPVCGTRIEYIKSKPQVCCSRGCSNTYRALNKPAIAELNHRVASVQDCGISDVYNITVDDYHNFATITREYESKKGNKKLSGIIVSNCGEQPLLPYESCVLGSINLSRLVEDGEVNWKRLGEIIPLAVRFLDNIIDLNKYPVEEIAIQTKATRKIGLGIMGWTEMLIQLRIPYDSEKALELAEQVMEFIRNRAERASAELAKVRGNFEHIDLLKQRRKWKRNATLITIAPTGSISLIAGTSSGIEPLFAIVHDRVLTEGVRLTDTNRYFVEIAEERGFWCEAVEQEVASTGSVQDVEGVPDDIKRLFKTAHEIDPEWHVRVQAAFQKHTDNAVSKTVNVPNNASTEDIRRVFLLADELGLKGITVFRDGSLEGLQVLYAGCPTCEDVRFTDSP